jgi:hypothetical protein
MLGVTQQSLYKALPLPPVFAIRAINSIPPRHQMPRMPVESEHSATRVSLDWIKKLQYENIMVPDARSVVKFVKTFPDIIQVVEKGISLIRYYFQDADRLVLEIFDEGSGVSSPDEQTLLLVIELKPSAYDALERLELLDEVWWHKLPTLTKMRVAAHVTLR